ncbi:MAG TPA: glycerol-3-phosphate 1-O-acyltransferase PlsY [Clostridiaceae bacterium]|nr:glycerol-3-phosphate 1-O-acyltransferase PlsY [Clostridiaceae bacterium]
MKMLLSIFCGILGYLLGSVNTSLVVGKFYGTDIRNHGSGNAGLTNSLRVLGKKAAFLVLLGDVLKGIVSCIIGSVAVGDIGLMAAGAGAILGHNWPVYFNFKGGKGVLVSASVFFMMDWRIALITLAIFILIVALTRYVSLGSIIGAIVFPIIAIIYKKDITFILFSAVIGLLAIVRHKSNIVRILNGTESKLSFKNSKK